jgi:hypothetical protein
MTHLNQDDLVLSYYADPALGSDRREHLERCADCRAALGTLAVFLDRVTPAEAPEPGEDYEARTWDRLRWKLRSEQKKQRNSWMRWVAAAAMFVLAFLGGLLLRQPSRRQVVESSRVATTTTAPTTPLIDSKTRRLEDSKRVLLVVVGEHMSQSERMLVELTNLTAEGETDITAERDRAQDLLASNRLYRTSAVDRGEESVATLLDELEPVLLQLAHAPDQVSAEELRSMQKRVEAKGLVFKLRVVRADVHRDAGTSPKSKAKATDI